MKKICITIILVLVGLAQINAQGKVEFGASGGYFLGSVNGSLASFNIDVADGSGFYLGFLADINVIDKFHVQPELLYANVGGEGSLVLPIMAKYYVANSFYLETGPQLDFLLDVPSLVKEVVKTFGISLGVGTGYDITESIAVQARYTFGLNDRIDLPEIILGDIITGNNLTVKTNSLQVGMTFKF